MGRKKNNGNLDQKWKRVFTEKWGEETKQNNNKKAYEDKQREGTTQ